MLVGRSVVACALCALALSTSPQIAISAEPTIQTRSALPPAVEPGTIQPATQLSRSGAFRQATSEEEAKLREAAQKMEMPAVPTGSDLERMLAVAGSSSDPRAHSR
mmetsp:Transcript_17929/g.58639  ORF Transcript_17929/g.58639 Transcript_17929/m.58639 type:complete len:106 (+) Transcript_17929:302-619(+)